MESFKIDKSLCELIPGNQYCSDWLQVKMPKESQYAGYATRIYLYSEESVCYVAYKSRSENWTFELTKIDREQGKRYKRYRLTWDELSAEFAEHQKRFDKSECPKGLAYVYDYAYRGGVEQSRTGKFVVGAIDGKWFWLDEYDKRRISAKNFRLISALDSKDVERVQSEIKELNRLEFEIDLLGGFNGVRDKFTQLRIDESFSKIEKARQAIVELINSEIEERKTAFNELMKKLEAYGEKK